MKPLCTLALAVLAVGAFPLASAETKKLVLVNDTYEPYVFDGKDAAKPGMDIEIATEALKRIGYTVDVQIIPWKRVLKTLEDGEGDFTTTLDLKPDRDAYLDWSAPYRKGTSYNFYVAKGSKLKAKTLEDLKGKTIGVTTGFSYPEDIMSKVGTKKEEAKDLPNTIEKLIAGRSDFIILNSVVGAWKLKESGLADKVEKLGVIHSRDETGVQMGFSKKKNLKPVIEKFNEAMAAMQKDGTMDKIYAKYTK